jgi:hypothetical protein
MHSVPRPPSLGKNYQHTNTGKRVIYDTQRAAPRGLCRGGGVQAVQEAAALVNRSPLQGRSYTASHSTARHGGSLQTRNAFFFRSTKTCTNTVKRVTCALSILLLNMHWA